MVETHTIKLKTKAGTDLINITDLVARKIEKSKIKDGIVTIFIPGSTASLSTIEYEPNLVRDMEEALERIAPAGIAYRHHLTWGDDNGVSHIRATLKGPDLTVPFVNRRLTLGTWQQIVLMDFDTRERTREIILQVLGE